MIDWFYDRLPGDEFSIALHQLRKEGEVVCTTALGGTMPVYYILSHRALADAFQDGEQFPPGRAYQIISLPFIGETFMSMDEERHRVWRPPMTASFRRHVIDQMDEHKLTQIGHDILDLVEGSTETDLVYSFTRRYAFRVICNQLGLPIEQEAEYYQWSMDVMFGGRDLEKSRVANSALTGMINPILAARRNDPKADQISRWLLASVGEEEIDETSILSHIRLFFTAGATTTSDAMSNLFHALLTHPGAWEQCVAEPEIRPQAIQELLRWNPPVAAQPRFTRPGVAVELAGVEIPANSAVLFGVAAANRDPTVFPDPDCFDISRKSKALMTFGPGLRTCPGMHLAQRNLEAALRIVADRFPRLRLEQSKASLPAGILLRGTASLPVTLR